MDAVLELDSRILMVILLILVIWILVLSIFVFFQTRFMHRLVKDSDEKDLVKVLKKILEKQDTNSKDLEKLRKEIVRQETESFGHVQKIGLIRFNPFRETGGAHSFSLAILDGTNTGVIITGIHTRERTRLYSKEVIKGKSDSELSAEEVKALEQAQKYHLKKS
jgi:hypothetical protein